MSETINDLSILVVDDLNSARKIMLRLLTSLGFANLAEAPSGQAALAAAQEKQFDLIVTDLNLSDMTGLQLMEQLLAAGCAAPFVVVTGEQNAEILDGLRQRGINLLLKPFNSEELRGKIIDALAI